MVKKLLKFQMQKQKSSLIPKSDRTLRSQKKTKKTLEDKDLEDMQYLAKKIQVLDLNDESQTKVEHIEVKKGKKKSISKGKPAKKSQQKTKLKQIVDLLSPEYIKLISTSCIVHIVKNKNKQKQPKLSLQELVSLQWFNRITSIWRDKKSQSSTTNKIKGKQTDIIKKTQRITYLSEITFTMMKRLKPKHWLNDEVINSYIQLMELDVIKSSLPVIVNNGKILPTVHLIQSYFATLKATTQKIQREIKKRKFTMQSTIIIPINDNYHWYFVIISNHQIFICDSILPKNIAKIQNLETLKNAYSNKSTIKKCFQLYETLYQIKQVSLNDVHVVKDFPQQDNQNDCGMMMLCGIKNVLYKFFNLKSSKRNQRFQDLIMEKDCWNFWQEDIKFLRFLFTRQLIEQKILHY